MQLLQELMQATAAGGGLAVAGFVLVKLYQHFTKHRNESLLTDAQIFERKLKLLSEQEESVTRKRDDLIAYLEARNAKTVLEFEQKLEASRVACATEMQGLRAMCEEDTSKLQRQINVRTHIVNKLTADDDRQFEDQNPAG